MTTELKVLRFIVGFVIGAILGVALLLIGGIAVVPAPPSCPGCAVLSHSVPPGPGCYPEAVDGGYICG